MKLRCEPYEFSMTISENNQILFEDEDIPICAVTVSARDKKRYSFEFGGLGLAKKHVESIIAYIEKTLSGDLRKSYHLRFGDSRIIGAHTLYSPMSFMIHVPEADEPYWEFIYEARGGYQNSGKTRYSICLCAEDLKNLKESLQSQMVQFDWENHGKIEYYEIELTGGAWNWCYDATELEKELSQFCTGNKLKTVFVSLEGYAYCELYQGGADFSHMGGQVLLVLNDATIGLIIHGEGLFEYRIYDKMEQGKCIKRYGYVPTKNNKLFYNLCSQPDFGGLASDIVDCSVIETDGYAFSMNGFDPAKIGNPARLPEALQLQLNNRRTVSFVADGIEYFYIDVKGA